ncbi:hypothetical protein D9757_009728 [Collybiopsis confluens]|uniref:Uncharacterized protein n=1 Tax=Collybiopsis confluens TaxID=2823264 RepID=A0A8H5H6B1_9AGAR|nr:hypothetical protein D9757_009728 [Collybiopsis confluens]
MPKPLKAPKLKIKEYKDPGYSKYVVVSNPWSQPEKSKLNLFGNTIGGWFETMTGKPVNMVFFESNRDHIIVELDRSVNVEPILGAHHTQDFFRHPGRSHTSEIFEMGFDSPNYTRLDLAKLPIKQDYPPPRKPQSSSTKMARRIPQNVMDMIGGAEISFVDQRVESRTTSLWVNLDPNFTRSTCFILVFAVTIESRFNPSTAIFIPCPSRPLPIEEHLPSVPSDFVPYAPSATFTAMRRRREHEHEIKREVKREVDSEGSLGTEHRREQERVRHNDHAQGESYRRDRDPGRASDSHRVGNGHEADADVKPRLSDLDKGFDIPSPRDQANAADGRPPGFGPGHDRESPHLSAASSSQSDSSYPSDSNHPTSSPSSSSFRADLSTRRNESKNQNQSWLSILDSSQPVNAGYQPPEWLGAYSNGLSAFSYQDNLDRDGHEGESSSGQEGATDHHGIDTSSGSGSCDHQSSPANTRSLYQNAKQEPSRVKVEIKAEVGDVLGRRSLYQNAKQELSRVKVEIKAEAEAGDDALGRDAAQDRERYGRYANHRGDERRHQSLSSAVSPPLPGVAVVKVKAEPGDENRNIGSSVPAEGRATSTVTPSTVVTVKLEPGIRVKSEPEDEHGKGLTRPGAFPRGPDMKDGDPNTTFGPPNF